MTVCERSDGDEVAQAREELPKGIIVDIDGTFALPVINLLRQISGTPIFVSGRKEKYRKITTSQIKAWNHRSAFRTNFRLYMRADDDFRSDVELKREIYENYIKDKYDVFCAIDDRKCIVDLWRSLGIFTLDVGGFDR